MDVIVIQYPTDDEILYSVKNEDMKSGGDMKDVEGEDIDIHVSRLTTIALMATFKTTRYKF